MNCPPGSKSFQRSPYAAALKSSNLREKSVVPFDHAFSLWNGGEILLVASDELFAAHDADLAVFITSVILILVTRNFRLTSSISSP